MSETRDYNGYSLFDDVESNDIRNHNQAVIMRNISEDMGSAEVKEYFGMLSANDQVASVRELATIAGR